MGLTGTLLSTLRWSSDATTVAEADALLSRLWASADARNALTPGSEAAVRTGVMNLVVVATGEERAAHAAATLQTLQRNPSRTLFIVPRDPEGPAAFKAHLEVFCAVTPRGDGTAACTELLWIDAGGPVARHLTSVIAPLALHDLPTLLWWDAPLDPTNADLRQMLRGIDRVMFDGSTQPGSGLETLRHLLEAAGQSGSAVSDFSLIRQGRWRDAVASMFDEPAAAPFLGAIAEIEIEYAGAPGNHGPVNIVKPLYHVAWLASRLQARVDAPLEPGSRGWSARLVDALGHPIDVRLVPTDRPTRPGTTQRVTIGARRRGAEARLDVVADGKTTTGRLHVDGAPVRERVFSAPRATEASLLGESLELGEIDPLSPAILRAAAALIGA